MEKIKSFWNSLKPEYRELYTDLFTLFSIYLLLFQIGNINEMLNSNDPLTYIILAFIFFVTMGLLWDVVTQQIRLIMRSKATNGHISCDCFAPNSQTGLTGAKGEGGVNAMSKANESVNLADPGAPLGSQTPSQREDDEDIERETKRDAFLKGGCLSCRNNHVPPFMLPCRTCDNGDAYEHQ